MTLYKNYELYEFIRCDETHFLSNIILQGLSCESVKGGALHLIHCMFDLNFIINTCMIYWKKNRFIIYVFNISPG